MAVRVATVVAVLAMAQTTPGAAAPAPRPDARFRCQVMAFSPNVERDGAGFCATLEYEPGTFTPSGDASVYRTTDGGRTWQRRRGEGLRPIASRSLKQLVFSPSYATDGAVYLHAAGRGLLRSTDGGDLWLPVAPLADSPTAHRNVTPYPRAAVPGGTTAAALAFAAQSPALVSPPVHVPVAGAPGTELQFLADPVSGSAYVASLDADSRDGLLGARTRLYACDPALACATSLYTFPPGYDWQDGWLAPDFATSGRIFAITFAGPAQRVAAWISTDRGRSFSRWQALDEFLKPLTNAYWPLVTIAMNRAQRTMYARISHKPFPHSGPVTASPPAPPGEQILRSDDAGRTWRRVAYGLAFGQPGRDGNISWDDAGNGSRAAAGAFQLLPDGRLVALGAVFSSYFGTFWSGDGARTWSRSTFS